MEVRQHTIKLLIYNTYSKVVWNLCNLTQILESLKSLILYEIIRQILKQILKTLFDNEQNYFGISKNFNKFNTILKVQCKIII